MDKDNYNIDDILSEVKKRNEAESEPETEAPETKEPETEAPEAEEPETEESETEESETEEPETEEPEAAEPEDDGEMVDLMELAEEEEPSGEQEADADNEPDESAEDGAEQPEEKKKKPKSKAAKIIITIVAVLLALTLVAGIAAYIIFNDWIDEIVKNSGTAPNGVTVTEWQGMNKDIQKFPAINETEATELSSLEDMIKTWYKNGKPCQSSHVLNVLLIGEDTRGRKILEEGTRADSAIIASVNIDTKEIHLVSILRDSWAYWETDPKDESTGQFNKLNGAMATGDIYCYMRTIENLYKVHIDNYAIVNFSSFEKIVNTLGGVELELTEEEINEVNNHPGVYGNVYIEKEFEGSRGTQLLDGKQTLAYCRIRHIDSDNARADRQKKTLIEIFKQSKDASMTKLIEIVKDLIPYIKTGFGKKDIVKIASYAITQGWLNYDIVTASVPKMNLTGGIYKGSFGNQWIWRADFPADAYNVQLLLYGKSCITLAHQRVDTKTVQQGGFYQDGALPTGATYTNYNYGEASTLPPEDEDDY